MKPETKAKISTIGWPIAYFALAIALSFAICLAARRTGYTRIYVSGQSMNPTLNGGSGSSAQVGDTVDFGYMDPSNQAINNIKRFNIVITYFPYSWTQSDYEDAKETKIRDSASYKIKRVIGLPGETVEISVSESNECRYRITSGNEVRDYVYDENAGWKTTIDEKEKVYDYRIRHVDVSHTTQDKNHKFTTLGPDEYFVMGDNWGRSSDSSTYSYLTKTHLHRSNIQGVLVAIEGSAKVVLEDGKKTINDLNYTGTKYYYMEL